MISRHVLLPMLLLAFSACTPMIRPGQAMDRVNTEFRGHDVGEFFISYGSAAGVTSAKNGEKSYRWVSIDPISAPSEAGYINYPGGHYAILMDETNGEMISGYCKVRIETDAQDRIKAITLVADSIGKYSGSRCAEIFGQP